MGNKTKMKVCVVGAIPLYSYMFCEAVFNEGVDVVYLLEKNPLYKLHRYNPAFGIFPIFKLEEGYLKKIYKLYSFVKNYKPDVLHFQWTFSPRMDWIFSYLFPYLKFDVVYTVHNIIPHEPAIGEKFALKKIYQKVGKLHVHSQQNKKELVERFKIRPEKIWVIPHGNFNLHRDYFGAVSRTEARKRMGLKAEEKAILFFGAIRKYKGLEYLLRAFQIVQSKLPQSRLIIGGSSEGVNIAEYYSLMEVLKIKEKTILYPYYVPDEMVSTYFMASDLVVLPYLNVTYSGMSHLAFTFGRPVVSTNVGGLPDLVEEGKNGLLVPSKDAVSLAEAIIDLLTDEKRLEEMGRYAQYVSENKYNWKNIAQELIKLYKS